jgi:hypothetical protein
VLKETRSFVAAIVFFAVCMCVCFIGAYAAEDDVQTEAESLKILVKNAEITAEEGVSGDCEAVFSDDTVSLNLDGFAYPGAYAQAKVTVYNGGTLAAVLDENQQVDCDIDGISVSFPQLENGEKIEPGEECEFTLVVKWDGDLEASQDNCSVSKSGDFSMKLTYSADIPDSSVPDSSLTDDSSSSVAESSLPDENSSSVANSSSNTESTVTDKTDSGNSTQSTADGNANTGVFSGKNMLLVLSAAFAMCAAMCAVQLYNAKKNGDETDE